MSQLSRSYCFLHNPYRLDALRVLTRWLLAPPPQSTRALPPHTPVDTSRVTGDCPSRPHWTDSHSVQLGEYVSYVVAPGEYPIQLGTFTGSGEVILELTCTPTTDQTTVLRVNNNQCFGDRSTITAPPSPPTPPPSPPTMPPVQLPTAATTVTATTVTVTTITLFLPTVTICSAADLDDCADGVCLVTTLGANCICENGNAGAECDVPICDTAPCFNGGVCTPAPGTATASYQCDCPAGLVEPQCGPEAPSLAVSYNFPILTDGTVQLPASSAAGTVIAMATATVDVGTVRFRLVDPDRRQRRDGAGSTPPFPLGVDPVTGEVSLRMTVTGTLTATLEATNTVGPLQNTTTVQIVVAIAPPATTTTAQIIIGDFDASSANEDDSAAGSTWWVVLLIVLLVLLCVGLVAFAVWRNGSDNEGTERKEPGVENPMYGMLSLPMGSADSGLYEAVEDNGDPVYDEDGVQSASSHQGREGASVNSTYMAMEKQVSRYDGFEGGGELTGNSGYMDVAPSVQPAGNSGYMDVPGYGVGSGSTPDGGMPLYDTVGTAAHGDSGGGGGAAALYDTAGTETDGMGRVYDGAGEDPAQGYLNVGE